MKIKTVNDITLAWGRSDSIRYLLDISPHSAVRVMESCCLVSALHWQWCLYTVHTCTVNTLRL